MKNRIKDARKKCNLTALNFSSLLGITKTTLSSWENNKREFSVEQLVKMSDKLGVSTDYLLCREEKDKKDFLETKLDITENLSAWNAMPVYSVQYGWVLIDAEKQLASTSEGIRIPIDVLGDLYAVSPDYDITQPLYGRTLKLSQIRIYNRVWVEPISRDYHLAEKLRGWYNVGEKFVYNEFGTVFYYDKYNAYWIAYAEHAE